MLLLLSQKTLSKRQAPQNRQSLTIEPTIPVLLIALIPGSPFAVRPGRATARGEIGSKRGCGTGRLATVIKPHPIAVAVARTRPSGSNSMNRQYRKFWSLVLIASMLASGCAPQQPFYFREDGDLSHYLGVATNIEYPDVQTSPTCEITNTLPPLTLKNTDNYEIWDLSLNQVVQITLCRSQVMRQLNARVVSTVPETISRNIIPQAIANTTYDPAIVETGIGIGGDLGFGGGQGVEAALSEFDAQLNATVQWDKTDQPQNAAAAVNAFRPPIFAQDLGASTIGISKTTAVGTEFSLVNNTNYEGNNIPSGAGTAQAFRSNWTTNFEARFDQPLLQGVGAQYNRIAGPLRFDEYASRFGNQIDGVMIARIDADREMSDFEVWHYQRHSRHRRFLLGAILCLPQIWKLANWAATAPGNLEKDGRLVSHGFTRRKCRQRGQGPLAILPVPLASGTSAYRRFQRRKSLAIHHGPVDVRWKVDSSVGRALNGQAGVRMGSIHCEALTRRVEIRQEKWDNQEARARIDRRSQLPAPAARCRRPLPLARPGRRTDQPKPSCRSMCPAHPHSACSTSGEFQDWQLGLESERADRVPSRAVRHSPSRAADGARAGHAVRTWNWKSRINWATPFAISISTTV